MKNSIGGSNPTILAAGVQRRQQHPRDNPEAEGDMFRAQRRQEDHGGEQWVKPVFFENNEKIVKKNRKIWTFKKCWT